MAVWEGEERCRGLLGSNNDPTSSTTACGLGVISLCLGANLWRTAKVKKCTAIPCAKLPLRVTMRIREKLESFLL